MMSDSADI
jgi:serine/threonine-protein phosphatase 2B catalytic subunit